MKIIRFDFVKCVKCVMNVLTCKSALS